MGPPQEEMQTGESLSTTQKVTKVNHGSQDGLLYYILYYIRTILYKLYHVLYYIGSTTCTTLVFYILIVFFGLAFYQARSYELKFLRKLRECLGATLTMFVQAAEEIRSKARATRVAACLGKSLAFLRK